MKNELFDVKLKMPIAKKVQERSENQEVKSQNGVHCNKQKLRIFSLDNC